MKIGKLIDRFGIEAVTGNKIIGLRLQKDIHLAENIVGWYRAREEAMKGENFAEWVGKYEKENKFLETCREDWLLWIKDN